MSMGRPPRQPPTTGSWGEGKGWVGEVDVGEGVGVGGGRVGLVQ